MWAASSLALMLQLQLHLAAQPAEARQPLADFAPVVAQHVDKVLGLAKLPDGVGIPVQPGVFVTITPERLQIFDDNAALLQGGKPKDPRPAAECRTGCSAEFFTAFERTWMDLAIEARALQLELPDRVLVAGHRDLPAATVVQAIYAAAESRPRLPPAVALLVHGNRSGLRMQPVYLLPPDGLSMSQGAATLGLTVEVSPGAYKVRAASRSFGREVSASSLGELVAIVRDIKKHYPGKEAIILESHGAVTLGEVAAVIEAVRRDWPSIILSAGQRVVAP